MDVKVGAEKYRRR